MSELIRKTKKYAKHEGLLRTFFKVIDYIVLSVWKLIRERMPLGIMLVFSKGGIVQRKVQGNKMFLDLHDVGISRELALYGVHERQSTEQIKKIVKPGMKILEVGANIGYYALLEGKIAGENGFVYAIEPSPYNFKLLTKNATLNSHIKMELRQAAFGAEKGRSVFHLAKKSNLSGLVARDDATDMYVGQIEVEVLTLDDFMRDKNVDLIRMDVEGYEHEVLLGAKSILATRPPRFFFIEVHSELLHKKGSGAAEIVRTLRGYGYEVVKSFYRGSKETQVSSTDAMLSHPLCEVGYWEAFFERNK